MTETIKLDNATVFQGDNRQILKTLADNSIDSIVTDPPYELGFMNKGWDKSGVAYDVELWKECLRVLKPGGHLLAFGGSRTWHRLAVAVEDAGFDIRDSIAWLYGSGFPKSHNISKAINKLHGVEFESKPASGVGFMNANNDGYNTTLNQLKQIGENTPEADKWDGWGTALKPAFEPIVVARKPLIGTVAENVLEFGTGGINIDASRIGNETISVHNAPKGTFAGGEYDRGSDTDSYREHTDRWPANVILDETTAQLLDQQSGITKTGDIKPYKNGTTNRNVYGEMKYDKTSIHKGDVGGASRFFYVAKASKRDRNEGLEQLPTKPAGSMAGGEDKRDGKPINHPLRQNFHPTVKPTVLMQYLIKLVTPPNGIVLDPFAGSGSTGKAAILDNYQFIGIELTPEYFPIIEGRLRHAQETLDNKADDLFE